MKRPPLIIVNPKSGGGTTERRWASMTSRIHAYLGSFDFRFTTGRGDATRIADEEARSGRELIIACGGDGTISEVANGILRSSTEAELGVLPNGTGGDFRMTMGLPRDIGRAARRIKDGKPQQIDVGRLHYVDRNGNESERFFVNTASFGLSGAVANRANASRKRLGGTVTYVAATMRSLVSFDAPAIILEIDDRPAIRLPVVTVCVANGPSFGGGMKIAPDAKVDDGFFNVIVIGDLSTPAILMNAHRLYSGTFIKMEQVSQISARRLSVTPVDSDAEILLEVDGESPGRLPATFEIVPRALRVRC
jgi:YegS/Rv2252/BmrU family lipid kinase